MHKFLAFLMLHQTSAHETLGDTFAKDLILSVLWIILVLVIEQELINYSCISSVMTMILFG
jgi:hypothetical protein